MAKLKIEHRELIEEENIQLTDLPSDIRSKIRGYNLNLTNYMKKPSESLLKTITKNDVELADMIQTWIEEKAGDAEELDSNEDNSSKFKPPVEPQPVVVVAPVATPEPTPEPIPAPPAEPEMDATEKLVRAGLVNGVIKIAALESILTKEANYPNQKVGNILLRKLYGRDEYKHVS